MNFGWEHEKPLVKNKDADPTAWMATTLEYKECQITNPLFQWNVFSG
jgi:hypothetical protein